MAASWSISAASRLDQFVVVESDFTRQPCTDGLANAADREMRGGLDVIVVQCPLRACMGEEQRREERRRLRAFAHDLGIRQFDAEQQAADAGIG